MEGDFVRAQMKAVMDYLKSKGVPLEMDSRGQVGIIDKERDLVVFKLRDDGTWFTELPVTKSDIMREVGVSHGLPVDDVGLSQPEDYYSMFDPNNPGKRI